MDTIIKGYTLERLSINFDITDKEKNIIEFLDYLFLKNNYGTIFSDRFFINRLAIRKYNLDLTCDSTSFSFIGRNMYITRGLILLLNSGCQDIDDYVTNIIDDNIIDLYYSFKKEKMNIDGFVEIVLYIATKLQELDIVS